jgi:ppGpp synthetase/RelA/SpoT-type nucleotidyltranferase
MKKNCPKQFLEEYEAKSDILENALEKISSLLKLRLGQLAARKGIRGRITDIRVKRPAKIWKKVGEAGLDISEIFKQTEDLLGLRIVCNNLSDINLIIEMIRGDCQILTILEIKDMVLAPSPMGYRATHIRAELSSLYNPLKMPIPCEIQIRTLAQDTWARLSRADLYGREIPPAILKLAQALSTHLSAIDETGQLIRDELNQCPQIAEEIKDTDNISPQRLALLYKDKFGEDIFEWSLIEWIHYLEEAEVDTIGEVHSLLNDTDLRKSLDKVSNWIRSFPLEDSEWAIYNALVATRTSKGKGIQAAKKRIKAEWDEIVAQARGQALSGMPDTIEEFVKDLKDDLVPAEALETLGGIQGCFRCGAPILRPEQAAEAVLDFYGNQDIDEDLVSLFEELSGENTPEVESVDFSGACPYCGHQMSKDD